MEEIKKQYETLGNLIKELEAPKDVSQVIKCDELKCDGNVCKIGECEIKEEPKEEQKEEQKEEPIMEKKEEPKEEPKVAKIVKRENDLLYDFSYCDGDKCELAFDYCGTCAFLILLIFVLLLIILSLIIKNVINRCAISMV